MPDTSAVIQIDAIGGGTLLQLKSWLPQNATFIGQRLPSQIGEISSGTPRVLCVGPGEWLVVSRDRRVQFEESDLGLAQVDVTDGLGRLELRGRATRELLSKGCGLDFHPRSFPAGRCARTRFAQIAVIIECLDAAPSFELYVGRSYLHYLHSWLVDAAAEFGHGLT